MPATIYHHDIAYDFPEPPNAMPGSRAEQLQMERLRADSCVIDTRQGIYSPQTIGYPEQYDKYTVTVVGEIALPIRSKTDPEQMHMGYAALLKEDRTDGTVDYVVQGLYLTEDGRAQVIANDPVRFASKESIMFGKQADDPLERMYDSRLVSAEMIWGPGVAYDHEVSDRQLQMYAAGTGILLHDTSPNGTLVRAECHYENEDYFDYTKQAHHLAKKLGKLTAADYFNGMKIIDSDQLIDNDPERYVNIDAWGSGGEALVIDPSQDPETYGRIRDDLMRRISRMEGRNNKPLSIDQSLTALYKTGHKWLSYHNDRTTAVRKQIEKAQAVHGDNRYMNIAERLREGEADCDDMTMLSRWLAKQLQNDGYLDGSRYATYASRKLNGRPGHAYALCEKPDGQIIVIDFAAEYIGPLEDTVGVPGMYNYFLPERLNAYLRRMSTRN